MEFITVTLHTETHPSAFRKQTHPCHVRLVFHTHFLGQNIFHDLPVDIGEPEVASLVAIRQSLVIEAKLSENCRLQVVNVEPDLYYVYAVVVRFSVGHAAAYAAACHPVGEAARVMIASKYSFC